MAGCSCWRDALDSFGSTSFFLDSPVFQFNFFSFFYLLSPVFDSDFFFFFFHFLKRMVRTNSRYDSDHGKSCPCDRGRNRG